MKKQKKAFYEEKVFNNAESASQVELRCETVLKRNKIGIIIGAAAFVWDIILVMLLGQHPTMFDSIGWYWFAIIPAAISYLVAGGLLDMLKILWKVTLNTYCIVPLLLIDLIAAYVAFMFTLAAVVIFLALILFVIRIGIKKDLKEAKQYLNSSNFEI